MKQNYVFYEKTNPFPGWIRMRGVVDPSDPPDGSTLAERLEQLKIKYLDADYKLFPLNDLPDPEAVKFDIVTETLVPIEDGDVTPKAKAVFDQSQIEGDQAKIMPDLETMITKAESAISIPAIKKVIIDHAKMIYQMRTGKVT